MLEKDSRFSSRFFFFSTIFCGYARVNNLFHLSALCLLGMLAGNPVLRRQLFDDRRFNTGLSLLCALGILLTLRLAVRGRHLLAVALIGVGVPALLFMTRFGDIFLQRMASGYQQSFIRFGIWRHTLELAAQKLFLGWRLDKQLSVINLLGDDNNITTTHSLYLAALLKGGAFGVLLLALVMIYGFIMAKRQCDRHQGLEGSLFLFAAGFYLIQGMFIISNPAAAWGMFWFPLAVVLTLPSASP